jgi:hypothetical protein
LHIYSFFIFHSTRRGLAALAEAKRCLIFPLDFVYLTRSTLCADQEEREPDAGEFFFNPDEVYAEGSNNIDGNHDNDNEGTWQSCALVLAH